MTSRTPLWLLALFSLTLVLPCSAQVRGYWRAASDTTADITGDIAFSETKLSINFISFPIVEIRDLKPEEISAVFDADLNAGGIGMLYRLNIPAGQRFLHKNTLCGTEDTQWMAAYTVNNTLRMALFSGPETPVLTFDAVQNSSTHCSTFIYVR